MSQMDWMAQRYERTSAPNDCSPANTGWTRFNKCSASIGLLRPVLPATDSLPALADYRAKLDRPEFVRKALDAWADEHGVRLQFIRPGKPVENAHIESFNGRLREECLNQHAFASLDDARRRIEAWRADYNSVRPHSALGQLAPDQFRQLNQPQTGQPAKLRVVYSAG
jgi:putative transposase